MTILDKAVAKKLYNDLLNLINEPNRLYYDKIIDLGVILEKIYNEITRNVLSDKEPLNNKIDFIGKNYTIPSIIIERSHLIRMTVNNKRHTGANPKVSYYPIFIETIMDSIEIYSDISIPKKLANAYENMLTKGSDNTGSEKEQGNEPPNEPIGNEQPTVTKTPDDLIGGLKEKFKGDVSRDVSKMEIVDVCELVIFVVSSILLFAGITIGYLFLLIDGGLFFYRYGKIKYLKVIPFITICIHIFFGVIMTYFLESMFGGFIILGALITPFLHYVWSH